MQPWESDDDRPAEPHDPMRRWEPDDDELDEPRDPIRRWGTDDDELAEAYGRRVIGDGVRRARLRQRLSQRQLGWRVGLNQSTISRLETGQLRTMRMVTLARVIGVLRLGPDHLFPGEPPGPTRRLPGAKAA